MTREELNKERPNLFCKFCGKQCKSLNSLNQHSTRCKENPNRKDFNKLADYSHNNFKGKNKYTNDTIAKVSTALKESYATGKIVAYRKGKDGIFKGKHHSDETKRKLAEVGRYNAKNHINGWKAGNSKVPNKYEKYTADFLNKHNIAFKQEVTISTGCKGAKNIASHYQLDFLVNNIIDLELDGTGHNFDNDKIRDEFVGKTYNIYRIKHADSIDVLDKELNIFIDFLNS